MIVPLCLSLFPLFYAFLGYPLLLLVLDRAARLPGRRPGAPELPTVSMLLSVYNEEAHIVQKIKNFLALDYPPDRLELILISDGSTDATEALAAPLLGERVRLERLEGRKGKTAALNLAATLARGELFLFTDADAMLCPDCARLLAQAFADPEVGLASGRSAYLDRQGRETASGLYRRYEEWIKEREGRLFGIAGADGAVYALRRDLYAQLPPEYINDLLHPVQTALAGRKSLAVPQALALEEAAESAGHSELARQTRIMAQSWLIVLRFTPALLRAGRWGFLWQLFSHKVLRWLALPLLLVAAVPALVLPGLLPALTLAGLAAPAVFALLGRSGRGGMLGGPARLFAVQSLAAMLGLLRLLRGQRFAAWTPKGQ